MISKSEFYQDKYCVVCTTNASMKIAAWNVILKDNINTLDEAKELRYKINQLIES